MQNLKNINESGDKIIIKTGKAIVPETTLTQATVLTTMTTTMGLTTAGCAIVNAVKAALEGVNITASS